MNDEMTPRRTTFRRARSLWSTPFRAVTAVLTLALAFTGGSLAMSAQPAFAAPSVGAVLTNPAQTSILSRANIDYTISMDDAVGATGGSISATLTNGYWLSGSTNQAIYCAAYGGTYTLSAPAALIAGAYSTWTCSNLTFSASQIRVEFPGVLAYTSNRLAAGQQVQLAVTGTSSTGTSSSSAAPVTILAPTATQRMETGYVGGTGGEYRFDFYLRSSQATGTTFETGGLNAALTLNPPVGAQSCPDGVDYGGAGCTAVTSVPFVPTPASSFCSNCVQPGGSGTPVNISGAQGDTIVSTTSIANWPIYGSVTVSPTWIASLRYSGSSPASGTYACTWSMTTTMVSTTLTPTSGSCGAAASTPASLATDFIFPPSGVWGGAAYNNYFNARMTNTGSLAATAGAQLCAKFDNSTDVVTASLGTGVVYGVGPWGKNAPSVARGMYEQYAGSCAGTTSVPTWYTAAQVDFTNAGTKSVNANEINAVRVATTADLAGGGVVQLSLFALRALATDTRGTGLVPGDRHTFVAQAITSTGTVTGPTGADCPGANSTTRTCDGVTRATTLPVLAGVTQVQHMAGPLAVAITGPLGAVTGQYVTFTATVDGYPSPANAANNYTARTVSGQPAVSVANVTATMVAPTGFTVDCLSVLPAPTTCTSTGSGTSIAYTITWALGTVTQGTTRSLTVPGAPAADVQGGRTATVTLSTPTQAASTFAGYNPASMNTTFVRQAVPGISKTTATPGILRNEPASWRLQAFSTTTTIDSATLYDLLPYHGDPHGSVITGSYALSSIDASAASGATVYVSSTSQAALDLLDGTLDGYLNPQSSTGTANAATIAAAFTCTLAQVGTVGCPSTLAAVKALKIHAPTGSSFLAIGQTKTVTLNVDTSAVESGDLLRNGMLGVLGNYVAFRSGYSEIAAGRPDFTVMNSVSPTSEVVPGGTATHTVTITNTGNVSLPFRGYTPTVTDDISGILDDGGSVTVTSAGGGSASISGGTLTWTPPVIPAGGTATLTFTAVAGNPPTGDKFFTTKVSVPVNPSSTSGLDCPPGSTAARCSTSLSVSRVPAFTSGAPTATAVRGTPYTFTITASGYSTPLFTIGSGTIPTGMSLSSAGVLSGTPTVDGLYTFTVNASNSSPLAPTTSSSYSIRVGTAPAITSGAAPTPGTVGTAYSHTLTTTGSPAPTFDLSAGTIPPGLAINPTTGVLSGTPTTAGNYSFTLRATNVFGNATKAYTVNIYDVPTITSAAPTSGRMGTAYTHTVTASGSPASTFSYTGTLPPGLSLNTTTGVISGTPTATGDYSFTVTASNGAATSASAAYTLQIGTAPAFGLGNPPSGIVGSSYSYTVTKTGYPTPTVLNPGGNLPPGLTLNGTTGVISGTPTTVGSYTYTLRLQNDFGTVDKSFTTVISSVPALTSSAPTTPATVGTAYSFTFTASGTPAPTFSSTGTLPNGLSLNATTGVLSGTPTTAGSFTFTILADNGVGTAAQSSYTVVVLSPPAITSSAPASPATVGTAYSHTITATGSPTLTFTRTSGALPTGLTMSPTGVISGTPTATGSFTFTVSVSNASATAATATYTIVVNEAPTITSATPAGGTVGTSYTHTVTATGTPAPAFAYTGTLPPGLSLNTTTGVLSGTPTTSGDYTYTIEASNGSATTDSETYTTRISSVPVITSAAPTAVASVGAAYTFTVTATGFPTPQFEIVGGSGSLPAGLSIDGTTGVISGTPTTAGASTFTVRAFNGAAAADTETYTITTFTEPVITSGNPPSGTMGVAYSHTVTASGDPTPNVFSYTGTLPPGLSLNTTTGVISGTPTTHGTFTYTVEASNGSATPGTATYSTQIFEPPVITSAAPPSPATVGTPYTFTMTATGTPAPTFTIQLPGMLPDGLLLDPITGVISGTPTTAGTSTFTVRATNGASTTATATYTIDTYSVPEITSGAPTQGNVGQAYHFEVTASGTPAPTFTSTGTLPPGVTLDPVTGVLSGTPTTAGTYTFDITADNGAASSDTETYTMTVAAPPAPPTKPSTGGGGVTTVSDQKAVAKLVLSPTKISLVAGDTQEFRIQAFAADGTSLGDYTELVRLATDVESDTFSKVTIRFTEAGEHLVTAEFGDIRGSVKVTISPNYNEPDDDTLVLTLSEQRVDPGQSVIATLEGEDRYGNLYDTDELTELATYATDRDGDEIDGNQITLDAGGTAVVTGEIAGSQAHAEVEVASCWWCQWWWVPVAGGLLILAGVGVWWYRRSRRTWGRG